MRAPLSLSLLVAAACATARSPQPPLRSATLAGDTALAARLADGRHTVQTVCLACHTESPPHRKAPPFRMIAMRYQRTAGDSAAGAIVAWVRAPAATHSRLPAHAVARFGLMPALPLPDGQLRNAALYVLSLAEPEPGGMGGMRGVGEMRGRKPGPGCGSMP